MSSGVAVKPRAVVAVLVVVALLAFGAPIAAYAAFGAVLLAGFACAAWLVGAHDLATRLVGPLLACVFIVLIAAPARAVLGELLADPRVQVALAVGVLLLILGGAALLYAKLRGAPAPRKPVGRLPLRERAVLVDPIRPDQVLAGRPGRDCAAVEPRRPDPLATPGGLGRDDDLGLFGRRRT